jgi:hypothetical protein
MHNYSILVVSCDKNINLLNKFFQYLTRFWDTKDIPIYVSLEKMIFSYNGVSMTVFNDTGVNWSKRVKNCLSKINSTSVLLLLDDFIIESPVNVDVLMYLDKCINDNNNIAHFALTTVPMKNVSDKEYYGHFYLRDHLGRYKTTLQCGMWRRKTLMNLLSDKESAWEFELYGNIRSYLCNEYFYALSDNKYKPIEYNNGLFYIQGKLNLIEVQRLEVKYNDNFYIPGVQDNNGIIIRDNTRFIKRVFRRIKITLYQSYYLLAYLLRKRRSVKKI